VPLVYAWYLYPPEVVSVPPEASMSASAVTRGLYASALTVNVPEDVNVW